MHYQKVSGTLNNNRIPTIVWLSPILPFINDTEENISAILAACINAKVYGILCFGMGLTLREGNREYFYKNLDRHFPGLKETYMITSVPAEEKAPPIIRPKKTPFPLLKTKTNP